MPKVRFPVGDIQSLQPAVDTRSLDKVFVLEGENFFFDSKGPKSGFGTRLVADNSLIENEGGVVQSITAGSATYVFTSKGCYVLSENRKLWIQVLDLETRWPDVPLKDDKKWTFVYLTKGIYFCHPVYGFHKMVKIPTDWYLDPRDQTDIPGLPYSPIAVAETNGRMIVLGSKYVAWSGPSNAEDFLPTLGGAGQELLSDRVAGNPITVVGFQNGFIVWTTEGCLTAEFIGGDTVFRFDRMTTKQLPVNSFAVEAMPDGSQLICTKQGIFQIQNAREPQQIVPLFSEFIRQRLEHETAIHVRLTYEMEQDLLFFQMRDWTNHYVHTFVCSLALDKWGNFKERHLGIIKLIPERGNYGYVDKDGRPHRFLAAYNRELTPHNFIGLESNIVIGYIKPPELHGEIDSLLEMHEINLGGHPAIPSWYEVDEVDLSGAFPVQLNKSMINLVRFSAVFHNIQPQINLVRFNATFELIQDLNIDGNSFTAANSSTGGLIVNMLATQSLKITKPLAAASGGRLDWDAWSAWPSDGATSPGTVPVPGQNWDNRYYIYGSNGGGETLVYNATSQLDPNMYASAGAAYTALQAFLPKILTGYTQYRVTCLHDNNLGDNRGGLSLLVHRFFP